MTDRGHQNCKVVGPDACKNWEQHSTCPECFHDFVEHENNKFQTEFFKALNDGLISEPVPPISNTPLKNDVIEQVTKLLQDPILGPKFLKIGKLVVENADQDIMSEVSAISEEIKKKINSSDANEQ